MMDLCANPYERHFGLWSTAQQRCLKKASVSVGGLGGIGAAQALMLAKAGVGTIRVADWDEYGAENIVEQAFATWDAVGNNKPLVASKEMSRHQRDLIIECQTGDLSIQRNADALVEGSDILFSAVDNARARISLGRAASRAAISMVVSANIGWTTIHTIYPPNGGGYARAWSYLEGVRRDDLGYPDLTDLETRQRVERDWRIWVLVLGAFRSEAAKAYLETQQEYCWYAAAPAFHAASLGVNEGVKLLLGLPCKTLYPRMRIFDLFHDRALSRSECARRHHRVAAVWGCGAQAVLDVLESFGHAP